MPCKPILAKIAVNEANPAEANAQKSHALPLMFFLSESKFDLMGDGRYYRCLFIARFSILNQNSTLWGMGEILLRVPILYPSDDEDVFHHTTG
ncbi:hypothetical protein NEIMUCOT_04227 [Neisseria mucosa ATCC 25996]|uniref:Uncharacterized protein n=1 Tax=Neisseria mucosa (strain ATCC 25996 / DSM 4631 / NCTC 10774 / M26) TaxID=546266 RepID=D2ZUD8_NEIM2|nr:hypothetical protein NEIMUCOT_04227 [Neisseria mucosa ATCC 25996]